MEISLLSHRTGYNFRLEPKRESIDLDDCKYLQLERDDNLQNKLKSFYKKK